MLAATVDRVEELGSDLLCFFTVDAPPATSEAIAEATGGGLEEVALITREGTPFCATFEPRSEIRVGDRSTWPWTPGAFTSSIPTRKWRSGRRRLVSGARVVSVGRAQVKPTGRPAW